MSSNCAFPHADADEDEDCQAPKIRPCLVLDVVARDDERLALVAYGTSAHGCKQGFGDPCPQHRRPPGCRCSEANPLRLRTAPARAAPSPRLQPVRRHRFAGARMARGQSAGGPERHPSKAPRSRRGCRRLPLERAQACRGGPGPRPHPAVGPPAELEAMRQQAVSRSNRTLGTWKTHDSFGNRPPNAQASPDIHRRNVRGPSCDKPQKHDKTCSSGLHQRDDPVPVPEHDKGERQSGLKSPLQAQLLLSSPATAATTCASAGRCGAKGVANRR